MDLEKLANLFGQSEMGKAGKIAMGDRRLIDSRTVMVYLWTCAVICSVVMYGLGWWLRGLAG